MDTYEYEDTYTSQTAASHLRTRYLVYMCSHTRLTRQTAASHLRTWCEALSLSLSLSLLLYMCPHTRIYMCPHTRRGNSSVALAHLRTVSSSSMR
jgi:hypothetical protein